jgi:uncharacterized protein (TIGR00106 family)
MSILAQFSIFPLDKGDSLSAYVSRAVGIIEKSGLAYKLGPMGTSIEGDWDAILGVITECLEAMSEESDRVYMVFTADCRKGRDNRITGKVESIKEKLGHAIKT